MKIKRILLSPFFFFYIAWVCSFAYAQNERYSRGLDHYFSELSVCLKLTDEQKEKTRAIIESNQKKQRNLFMKYRQEHLEKGPPDMELLRMEMEENHKFLHDQLSKVLSPEQMEAYKKYNDELRITFRERMENRDQGIENGKE